MNWNILNKANSTKEIMQNILKYKNMTKEEILNFINFNIEEHDPYLLTNLDKAIDRILNAIEKKETITIIGDYDVDGICATTVLYLTLKDFTQTYYIIPDRFKDGYGISNKLINKAQEYKTNLIITVDNGIKAHEQVKYCKELNMDIIITDHHAFEDNTLPAKITINPQIDNNYPFKNICGCTVAYKLSTALLNKLILNKEYEEKILKNDNSLISELKQFVCLATIADVMPLIDENRLFIKEGLDLLTIGSNNIGLDSLLKQLNINKVTSNDIAFYIAPCINAAGRLESPNIVMDLFLCEDFIECDKISKHLIELNNKRKEIQKEILDNLIINDNDDFIVQYIDKDLPGIVGIIAGNIVEKYKKPCFCLCGTNDILHGSGRSINGFPINQIIEQNDFLDGGGHKDACGIKVAKNNLSKLQEISNKEFKKYLNDNPNYNIESIDIINKINFNVINDRLINNINKLQPFGNSNEEPLFCTENVFIKSSKIVGVNKNVIQLILENNNIELKAIGFKNIIDKFLDINKSYIDIIYTIGFNEWPKNIFNIQLNIKDIK